jgi:colicin import membrane protein
MRLSPRIDKEPTLQRLVIISASLHLFIMLLTFVPFRTGDREFRSYHVKLIGPMELNSGGRTGVKRPRRIIPKKRLPPAKTKQKKITKTISRQKSEMALKRAEETIAREIQRLRAIKEIERHRKESEGKREKIEIIRNKVQSASAGEDGITGKGTGVDANSYYGIIIEMIRNQWVYPDIVSSELEVIVSIRIDKQGNIISQEIEKSSGNILFDQSALRAISKANPLPPPPFGMETEIGVRFIL